MDREQGAMTRRDFVKGAAGVVAIAAVAGVGGVAVRDRVTQPADPADIWEHTTGLDRILLAATMAPSSHNTQPWRFRVGSGRVDLIGDRDRTMGEADPRSRESHVSLGCALENAVIAAGAAGTPMVVDDVPGPAGSASARLRFEGAAATAAPHADLAVAIPLRRTNRGPYDSKRTVARSVLESLSSLACANVRVVWLTDPADLARFRELSVRATEMHVADSAMQRDSHRWYRMSRGDAERHRDGVTLAGANMPAALSFAMGLIPPSPDSFDAGWVDATRDTHCGTAAAFGLLVVGDPGDRRAWVEAGRTYERMALAATLRGVSTHPISQALAIRDRDVAAGREGGCSVDLRELGGEGEVALAFRIGYPTREQERSLRRPPSIVMA